MLTLLLRGESMVRVIFWLFVLGMSYASADSFTMEHDGRTYICTEDTSSGGGCWGRCPYSFDTCADSCGGGRECWDACPYSFDTCADSCGGGNACWAKCPYSFSTCADSCGAHNVSAAIKYKFLLQSNERIKNEIAHGIRSLKSPALSSPEK